MKMLANYFQLQRDIFDYFEYVEDWRILPMVDSRNAYWKIVGGEGRGGSVRFAPTKDRLKDEEAGDYYENEIYTQRFLPKWVYKGEDYTMICVDTRTDGNQYLQVFSNDRRVDL